MSESIHRLRAVRALATGKSLLAAGVTRVEGRFERGDPIEILGPDGTAVARGLAGYDAADAAAIAGARNEAQAGILGYAPRGALVCMSGDFRGCFWA